MNQQDKLTANGLFWRELLDKLPSTVLIFRIDADEDARLFFVNSSIRKDLGFNPDEYVLASETENSVVGKELEMLIDEVARLSHEKEWHQNLPKIALSNRQGKPLRFGFTFHVFQARTSRNNMITVTLIPASEPAEKSESASTRVAGKRRKMMSAELAQPEVEITANSDVMKAVLSKAELAASQPGHVVVQGEASTGKKLIAKRIADTVVFGSANGAKVHHLDARHLKNGLIENLMPADSGEIGRLTDKTELVLVIHHFHAVSAALLKDLNELSEERQRNEQLIRFVITTQQSLEHMVAQNKLPATFLYQYSFFPVLVPPLRHRKEDLPKLLRFWSRRLIIALDLDPEPKFTDDQMEQLLKNEWPQNFDDLKEFVRFAVLNSKNGQMAIYRKTSSEPGKQVALFAEQLQPETGAVLSYDDMSRAYFRHVLDITKGKIYGEDGAASLLGMPPTTFQSKLKKLGVR
ncbi:MAG: hypothetical protein LAT67_04375 [Balneolales bacterium]|nr:hypothetical protein [Balneolales bacterium]